MISKPWANVLSTFTLDAGGIVISALRLYGGIRFVFSNLKIPIPKPLKPLSRNVELIMWARRICGPGLVKLAKFVNKTQHKHVGELLKEQCFFSSTYCSQWITASKLGNFSDHYHYLVSVSLFLILFNFPFFTSGVNKSFLFTNSTFSQLALFIIFLSLLKSKNNNLFICFFIYIIYIYWKLKVTQSNHSFI